MKIEQTLLGVVGFIGYLCLNKWSQKEVDFRSNDESFLPVALQSNFVPLQVKQVHHYFRKRHAPWITTLNSLSSWRVLSSSAYDTLFVCLYHLYRTSQIVNEAKHIEFLHEREQGQAAGANASGKFKPKRNRLPELITMKQSEYDEFTFYYKTAADQLSVFKQKVIETHKKYDQFKQLHQLRKVQSSGANSDNREKVSDESVASDVDTSTIQYKRANKQLDRDIHLLAFWILRLKKQVDSWFLSAKWNSHYA